jgi:phosphomannomutase
MKKIYVFDVDGTLTPSRSTIDPAFKEFMLEWLDDHEAYLVSGSDYEKTKEQLGDDLAAKFAKCFSCSGSSIYQFGMEVYAEQWEPSETLIKTLESILAMHEYKVRTGMHIEIRTGMINFSIPGRGATTKQRADFIKADARGGYREYIAEALRLKFWDLDFVIGGETGIDIHPKGADKSQILVHLPKADSIYFLGDSMHKGGNDYSLAHSNGITAIPVQNWEDTLNYLLRNDS